MKSPFQAVQPPVGSTGTSTFSRQATGATVLQGSRRPAVEEMAEHAFSKAQSAGAATTPARLQTLILLTGFPAESRSTTLGGALLQQYFGQMLQQYNMTWKWPALFHGRRARIGQSQAGGNVFSRRYVSEQVSRRMSSSHQAPPTCAEH